MSNDPSRNGRYDQYGAVIPVHFGRQCTGKSGQQLDNGEEEEKDDNIASRKVVLLTDSVTGVHTD